MAEPGKSTPSIVDFNDVSFTYDAINLALNGVMLEIKRGEFLCVLGGNGSGKSTLAKHINALLLPDSGDVNTCGRNTKDPSALFFIRSNAGMVFQNPDDQIVASVIEDDVAFGPENLGVPNPELRERVEQALLQVGLQGFERRDTLALSGGQKQRVAIAGALAMNPQVLVLDEASAMLDPQGRSQLMKTCRKLNDKGLTIVLITHFMEEAAQADRVVVLKSGHIADMGSPEAVLSKADELRSLSLDVPFAVRMSTALQRLGVPVGTHIKEEALENDIKVLFDADKLNIEVRPSKNDVVPERDPVLRFNDVSYTYASKSELKRLLKKPSKAQQLEGAEGSSIWALKGVSFEVREGEFLGLAGHTGSGKSTLMQLAAGILLPTEGEVLLNGKDLSEKREHAEARKHIGIVFQYPENQLFAQTVYEDVAFGPRNMGLDSEEVEHRVKNALEMVHINFDEIKDRNPFSLSGGQRRRVAIAGVLAMEPKTLILDEPTAGLDPATHDALLDLIAKLHKQDGLTLVLVSHNMDDISRMCDRMIVLNNGSIFAEGSPMDVFSNSSGLSRIGLEIPHTLRLANALGIGGFDDVPTIEKLTHMIAGAYDKQNEAL